ncbi:MAG: SafA/ExsA family spore coat assembly protein [Clostridiales bacterium]
MLIYIVKKGDTLWQISKKFGISLEALIAANTQLADPNEIMPGDRIYLPDIVHKNLQHRQDNNPHLQKEKADDYWQDFQEHEDLEDYEDDLDDRLDYYEDHRERESLEYKKNLDIPYNNQSLEQIINQENQEIKDNLQNSTSLDFTDAIPTSGDDDSIFEEKIALRPDLPFIYQARGGESLLLLAKKYNIKPQSIQRCNRHISVLKPLQKGEKVYIPGLTPALTNFPCPPKIQPRYVQEGASLKDTAMAKPGSSGLDILSAHQNTDSLLNDGLNSIMDGSNKDMLIICPYCGKALPGSLQK